MLAKLKTPCRFCGTDVLPGQAMFPKVGGGYFHFSCAQQYAAAHGLNQPEVPVCKHWLRRGMCLMASKCFFRHPPEYLQELAATKARRADQGVHNDQRKIQNRGPRRRNLVRNRFRATMFRWFLLDTYGVDVLRSGSGVLDVAGGKGHLAFELVNLNAVPCTVVDARPMDLNKYAGWLLNGIFHRNSGFQQYNHMPLSHFTSTDSIVPPKHMRLLINQNVIDCVARNSTATSRTCMASPHDMLTDDQAVQCDDMSGGAAEHLTLMKGQGLAMDALQQPPLQHQGVAEGTGVHAVRTGTACSAATLQQAPEPMPEQEGHKVCAEQGRCEVLASVLHDLDIAGQPSTSLPPASSASQRGSSRDGAGVTSSELFAHNVLRTLSESDRPQATSFAPSVGCTLEAQGRTRSSGGVSCKETAVGPVTEMSSSGPDGLVIGTTADADIVGGSVLPDDGACEPCPAPPDDWPAVLTDAVNHASHVVWTRRGLTEGHEDAAMRHGEDDLGDVIRDDTHAMEPDGHYAQGKHAGMAIEGKEVNDPDQAWHLLRGCSAVVGMHPDQATEYIVDLGLQLGKPFAVVPCCVYSCDFPRRKLRDGTPVTTYNQFIDYLVAKRPERISVKELPFEGRNKVVFWDPARGA